MGGIELIRTFLAASAVALFASAAVAAPVALTTQDQPSVVKRAPITITDKAMDTIVAGVQPADPGGFGQDRAAWIHAHSGAEWGVIAGERAGDNGAINNDYKVSNGDLPAGVTPGN